MENKKAVMGEVISVFVLVLVVSILAGLTFLFVANLKTQVISAVDRSVTVTNETGWINATGYKLALSDSDPLSSGYAITTIRNASYILDSGNYTLATNGNLTNTTTQVAEGYSQATLWDITYTYNSAAGTTAYTAVNDTEAAGATVVAYLPLIFLALIFGAVLTLVLKIILPYINLGQSMGGF